MKLENKRIFINDLPETTTPDKLQNAFKNYGTVTSTEIKERKDLGLKNSSLFFAFINIDIDDRSLQQCFKDFGNGKWFDQSVALQIARESFLDRLKREREETGVSKSSVSVPKFSNKHHELNKSATNRLTQEKIKKPEPTDSESEESDSSYEEDEKKEAKGNFANNSGKKDCIDTDETLDLVIKDNRGKTINKNGLKIESVGKSPILTIDKSKKKAVNSSEANLKRLQSLNNLKNTYKTQKSLIQQALSKVDNSENKIIFHENVTQQESKYANNKSKRSLFDEEMSEDEDNFQPNFEVKEQFQGEKGQKLLELQSRYKNDKRFILDKRFLEDDEDEKEVENQLENSEEMSLEEEKKKEYDILQQVLGKKVLPKRKTELESQKKVMLRFDPSQPEHSKFELKSEAKKEKKRKQDNSKLDILNEKKREEPEAPEVSKEVFYKVTDNLKHSMKEKQEFSLLSMFGTAEEKEPDTEDNTKGITRTTNSFVQEKNPFRYDSSDDEDETKDIQNAGKIQQTETPMEVSEARSNRNTFWVEPFFFTDDDYRLQEGVDFVEKMSTKDAGDFTKLRRGLKEIVKAKVRNNQRKNRPFKKKLGGSKKKKMLKIKRALKR